MKINLIWNTPDAEKMILYMARVSNPDNQSNEDTKLINYLIKNKHWSPFEMANMCVEIETSMAIGEQILRHRSFSFQKFSGRYAEFEEFEPVQIRKQAVKNRQSSTEIFNPLCRHVPDFTAEDLIHKLLEDTQDVYERLLNAGVAKECARMILPACTKTRMYMNGTLRSWIHYLEIRDEEHAQLEHQEIAREIKRIFKEQFPAISRALGY